ncbi:MAG: aminoacyl-tRNA hydrolase [Spirochaetales bacterium]|nr:aminoacyl-tRNA hydrolase [Candidatus Physcosoma equi]
MIKLMVFLGNPGKEYARTRHNAGFLLCDYRYPSVSWQSKFHSLYGQDGSVKILKPLTYMNLSGTAVSECTTFFKIKPEEVLVIHDDLEIAPGKAKLQKGGGLQGHNGLRSIKERLGSDQFYRLRIGIGRPVHGDVRVFVTSPFTENEFISLNQLFSKLSRALDTPDKEAEFTIL